MSRLSRVLAPLSVAVGVCAFAPAAHAGTTATFPDTTVTIADPGASSSTVHLTVTADNPADLSKTKVFLGRGASAYTVVASDGVRDARYDDDFDGPGELSTQQCSVYSSSLRHDDVPVTVAGDGASFSADLPKGEVIAFEETDVAVGIVGRDAPCGPAGYNGLALDFLLDQQTIDGFSWQAPATPVVTGTGGRRQLTLGFAQEAGTSYEIWRVVNGVRESAPFRVNWRGKAGATEALIDMDDEGHELPAGTQYTLQVRAVRQFNVSDGNDMIEPSSGFSLPVTVATNPVQTVAFTVTPATATTARDLTLHWIMTGNPAGEAPICWLDLDTPAGVEVPCTSAGVSLTGLGLGTHTLTVFPADGEAAYTATWTVVAAPTTPVPPVTTPTPPTSAPKNQADLDGDGIETTWLVNGKPAAAPKTPKVAVTGKRVKLTLATAPKGAKSIRVYRADGKGTYTLVKTLKPGSKTFTDSKVKAGKTYKYKTVAVNAKGQQGKASGAATAKVKK